MGDILSLLDPKTDSVFKRIFGDERNRDVLADFLKCVLTLPEEDFVDLDILDPHSKISRQRDKEIIMDIRVRTKSGRNIDIEIQRAATPHFRERMIYYGARSLGESLDEGVGYRDLNQSIVISICDFQEIRESRKYYHRCFIGNQDVKFSDLLEFHILELPKLPEKHDGTLLWDWLRFLKVSSREELHMLAEKNHNIKKAAKTLEELSEDWAARMIALDEDKYYWDNFYRKEAAEQAEQKGLEEGLKRGLEKGLEQGLEKGLEQGKYIEKVRIARTALQAGVDMDTVARITGLSCEEITQLDEDRNNN